MSDVTIRTVSGRSVGHKSTQHERSVANYVIRIDACDGLLESALSDTRGGSSHEAGWIARP